MKWSWRVGRILGVELFVHATFFILLLWVFLSQYQQRGDARGALAGVAFLTAVFGIVVLHELGHALMARRYGIKTRDITLLPIGGVARLERMPDQPRQELWVALAGPAVNVALALGLAAYLRAAGEPLLLPAVTEKLDSTPLATKLLWVNVSLAVFNLLPAFPMDGGRVLRAILAMRGDYVRATERAAAIGQGLALLLGLWGLFSSPMLVFVALFVWIGASSEAGAVHTRSALAGLPIQAAMLTDFHTLSADDSLEVAAQALLAGSQVDFPVLDERGELTGVLTRADLIRGLTERGAHSAVASAMSRSFETAEPTELLEPALERLQRSECPSVPVLQGGRVVGLVTPDNIGELVMLRGALRAAPG